MNPGCPARSQVTIRIVGWPMDYLIHSSFTVHYLTSSFA